MVFDGLMKLYLWLVRWRSKFNPNPCFFSETSTIFSILFGQAEIFFKIHVDQRIAVFDEIFPISVSFEGFHPKKLFGVSDLPKLSVTSSSWLPKGDP